MARTLLLLVQLLLLNWRVEAEDTEDSPLLGPEFVSVAGNGVVHLSPFNQAARNWDEEEPIPANVIGQGAEVRITGGHVGSIDQIPYYVLISKDKHAQWCGGTIYNQFTIVTAAHCLFSSNRRFDISKLKVTAGESSLKFVSKNEVIRNVGSVEIHPNYSPSRVPYDVAVLCLSEALTYSRYIEPLAISLPDMRHKDTVMVAGFGYVKQKRSKEESIPVNFADTLKYAHATIVQKPKCLDIYKRKSPSAVPILKHETLMCALGEEREGITDDACQGDSGGPAVCTDAHNKGYLCGIIATGIGCGQKDFPGIYTNVSTVSEWVEENAAHEACPSGSSSGPKRSRARNKRPTFEGENHQGACSRERKQPNASSTAVLLLWISNLLLLSEFIFGGCLYNSC